MKKLLIGLTLFTSILSYASEGCINSVDRMIKDAMQVGTMNAKIASAEEAGDEYEVRELDAYFTTIFTTAEESYAQVSKLSFNKWYLTNLRIEAEKQGYNSGNGLTVDVTKLKQLKDYIIDNGCN